MVMLKEKPAEHAAETVDFSETGRVLILLYKEAINGLHAAARAAEDGRILERLDATVRASEAVCKLHLGLDHENGGAIAANLDQLYRFVQAQIPRVNVANDPELARRLAGLLEPLLESWLEVIENYAPPGLEAGNPAQLVELSDAGAAQLSAP